MAGLLNGLRSLSSPRDTSGGYNPLESVVPLREGPEEQDDFDSKRIEVFLRRYNRQTDTLLIDDRQIEYNVRMLCNQQWNFWNREAGQFVDVSDWFTAEEARWRRLPTVNEELRWFVNTHARLTENPPTLTWLPGPDRTDSMLAEVLDTLVKLDWRRTSMPTLHPEIMMWVAVAGRAHAVSRIDLTKGEWRPWMAAARLPMVDAQLNPIMGPDGEVRLTDQEVPDVPIRRDGSPNAVLAPNGEPLVIGPGHMERSGGLAVDVLSPLQVRGEWGPQLWHKKRWHAIQRFMTPEQVFESWGVEVEPDVNADGAANVAILERVLYGAGFYGTTRGVAGGTGYAGADVKGPLCTVVEQWEAPLPFDERMLGTWAEPMMETPENPGGRHTILTPKTVILDGPREVAWPNVSPVRCWDFIRIPGRPRGVTPLEILHGPQRSLNKLTQLIEDSTQLNGAPQRVLFTGRGITADQVDNAPNRVYESPDDPAAGAPIIFLEAPPLNNDVWRSQQMQRENIERLGGLRGQGGQAPTEDASGELVKELRFNEDRDLGDTARRAAEEYGRLAEDWRAAYRILYDREQVIVAAGVDNIARTITVWPELFEEGSVNVQADAESMLPEGRGERQSKAYRLFKDGVFNGDGSPDGIVQGIETFLEISRFPNYSKMARPGGIDRETAERENGDLIMGVQGVPVFPFYDDQVHLRVHNSYRKSWEYKKLPPEARMIFDFHCFQHEQQLALKMARAAEQAARMGMGPGGPGGPPGGGGPPNGGGGGGGESKSTSKGPAELPKSRGGEQGRSPVGQSRPGQ